MTTETAPAPAAELAPRPTPAPAAPQQAQALMHTAAPGGQALSLFADRESFAFGQRAALLLSNSSIVPNLYRSVYPDGNRWVENPDAVGNCFIALELAQRLRTSPLVVMQQVDMIHGRPALRGTFLIALINASGEFSGFDFECNEAAGDAYGYRAVNTRLRDGKVCVGPWITWAMVKGEGWNKKTGSKWNTMSELMFQYRAGAFWSRLFAPHITLGLQETEEAVDALPAGASWDGEPVRAANLTGAQRLNALTAEDPAAPAGDKEAAPAVTPAKPRRGQRPKPTPAPQDAEAADARIGTLSVTDVDGATHSVEVALVDRGETAVINATPDADAPDRADDTAALAAEESAVTPEPQPDPATRPARPALAGFSLE